MATVASLKVDREKCTGCAICAEVCPSGIIRVQTDGPELTWPKACISCGHCVAVCPHAALDHSENPLTSQVEIFQEPRLGDGAAERFLRSRRSIRAYRPEKVAPDVLRQLAGIGRFAPSGGNSQGISYLVLSDSALLKNITEKVVEWLEAQIQAGVAWVKPYAGMAKIYRDTGYDIVLRQAPHLLLALTDEQNPIGRENGRYSLTYVELFAPSLGLGSCWAGFFEMAAFAKHQPLLDLLELPAGKALAGAVMLGVPKYRYHRLVDRNPLELTIR